MEVLKCAAMDLIMVANDNPRSVSEMSQQLTNLYEQWERECDEERESSVRWVESCEPFCYLKNRITATLGKDDVPKKDEVLQVAEILAEETKIPFPTKAKRTRKAIYEWLDQNWDTFKPVVEQIKFTGPQ